MGKSFKEYVFNLGHWGWVVVGDFIFSGIGAYLDISGSTNFPTWVWLLALLLALLIAPFIAFHKLRQKKDFLASRLERGVELVYSEKLRSCKMTTAARVLNNGETRPPKTLIRVGIRSLGQQTINDTEVLLQDFEPQSAPFLPIALSPMHTGYNSPSTFTVHPREDEQPDQYVEVAEYPVINNEGNYEIKLCYHEAADRRTYPKLIPVRDYVLTLVVHGEDAKSDTRKFKLPPKDGTLIFTQLD